VTLARWPHLVIGCPERETLFVFERAENARIFVKQVAEQLYHVALYIEGEVVLVLDGGADAWVRVRKERIAALARISGEHTRPTGPAASGAPSG